MPRRGNDSANAEDADLVQAVATGDRQALAALYQRHATGLRRLAQRLLRSTEAEAEDLLHDLWIEVWHRAGDFDPARGSVQTWLRTRLRSRALDRLRAAPRQHEQGGLVLNSRVGPRLSTDSSAAADRAVVGIALAELPAEQREVMALFYRGGLTADEIAEQTGLPLGTVKTRLRAARLKLRDALLNAYREAGVRRPAFEDPEKE